MMNNNNNNNNSKVNTSASASLPVNPYHKKVTLFPTPTGHHHQKKERSTLPSTGTTGIEGTDLLKNVEVYSAAGDELYTIPMEDIISLPQGTQANDISKKVHLCPYFEHQEGRTAAATAASCPHSQEPEGCKHIHASLANAIKHDVHINYLWKNLSDVKWERFAAGQMFHIAPPNETVLLDIIPSELIIKTKAFDGHNGNNNGKRVISHCAHYYYNRTCNRGSRCCFVHAVSFTPHPPKNSASEENKKNNSGKNNFSSAKVAQEERKSYGRTQHLREFPTLAAAQQNVRENAAAAAALTSKKAVVVAATTPVVITSTTPEKKSPTTTTNTITNTNTNKSKLALAFFGQQQQQSPSKTSSTSISPSTNNINNKVMNKLDEAALLNNAANMPSFHLNNNITSTPSTTTISRHEEKQQQVETNAIDNEDAVSTNSSSSFAAPSVCSVNTATSSNTPTPAPVTMMSMASSFYYNNDNNNNNNDNSPCNNIIQQAQQQQQQRVKRLRKMHNPYSMTNTSVLIRI